MLLPERSGKLSATATMVEQAKANRDHHPSKHTRAAKHALKLSGKAVKIPARVDQIELSFGDRGVRLTNLNKLFWTSPKITKRDLLQYYADVSTVLLPHLVDRAMVMKRYPNGAAGQFFFMKRAPAPRPPWIETCSIEHASGNVLDFPMIQDVAALPWVINLGCIDLNQWYARCDDLDRPHYLHFHLHPGPGAPRAGVSMPVTWREVRRGVAIDDFRMDNAAARLTRCGDLWAPLLAARARVELRPLLAGASPRRRRG